MGRAEAARAPLNAGAVWGSCFWVGVFWSLLLAVGPARAQTHEGMIFLDGRAFGEKVVIEIEDFGSTVEHRDALTSTLALIQELAHLTDPEGSMKGGLGQLNRAAGKALVEIDPRLADLVGRALNFCQWSGRAHGPLGGNLYGLWGLHQPVYSRPERERLRNEAEKADCLRLHLESRPSPESPPRAALASGSRVDLWGFAQGFAVDRAIENLRQHRVASGWVEIGYVVRAFGDGPNGRGWPASANPTEFSDLEERVLLRDSALAMASHNHRPLDIAGDRFAPWIDQRHGNPVSGVVATLAVTELAIDAQGLASSLFILGTREGEYRLGQLQPVPAVQWMLGTGTGRPLVTGRGWAALPKW